MTGHGRLPTDLVDSLIAGALPRYEDAMRQFVRFLDSSPSALKICRDVEIAQALSLLEGSRPSG